MLKLGLRPRYSQKRNTYVGFSLQCGGGDSGDPCDAVKREVVVNSGGTYERVTGDTSVVNSDSVNGRRMHVIASMWRG